jgi:hypothetical protein
MDWWEYLDQIWDAAETAERTSLTVLPALMLRARREPASQEGKYSRAPGGVGEQHFHGKEPRGVRVRGG